MALIEALKMLHWKAFYSRVNLKCLHLLKTYWKGMVIGVYFNILRGLLELNFSLSGDLGWEGNKGNK